MDNALRIPGTGFRVGIDPVLGLIPGVGDLLSASLGFVILYDAARCKVRRRTQAKVALNVLINAVFGAIPSGMFATATPCHLEFTSKS